MLDLILEAQAQATDTVIPEVFRQARTHRHGMSEKLYRRAWQVGQADRKSFSSVLGVEREALTNERGESADGELPQE